MKANPIFKSLMFFYLIAILTVCCNKGGGGDATQKLSVENVKKMIDVSLDGFEKKLDEQGLYGGPSVMFTRQSDKQRLLIATNANPEETAFTDDMATAQMSFDKANGEVVQRQVNGKNVYTQTSNTTGTEQYKAVVYQGNYRITFGADGKDATEIKKLVDNLVEKVTANLKK